ncbi:MAG: DUF3310 domain-containing protein [Bifidobacterium mongoliense]|jgi:hypothetical protein|uniref:DUF3310 domain-containing protein n=1 Tax=Bifidobacterium mongoliense TaxID=518643 RepID=UPI002F34FF82
MSMDPVNHPSHYTSDRFPFECIELTAHMDFCMGNMVKYVWRHLDKGKPVEDLEKARFYLNYELGYTDGRIVWAVSPDEYDKLGALADPSNHYDYQPFWSALFDWDVQALRNWLDQEIAQLEAQA